ncbi:MAG: acetyltransferase, ribosomal protein N-acetylase [Flavipsychrobacter sp.]|jgi:ribosomal-protein-alanine N-acetyltransferase|nr:acetyltransferase, ribosomal protein N-acetylase [Flavipsychrobacter sp.]
MLQVNFNPFPVLATERLVLRAFTNDDVNEMYRMRTDEAIMRYIDRPRPKSIEETFPFIEKITNMVNNNEGIAWAITLKDAPTMIGHMSFHILMKAHYRAEVGYMMDTRHQGKGLVSEALKAVLQYGFNIMGLHSVEAHVNPENTASRKLLEANNFKQEAYFKENFYWEGSFRDTVIYSLLKPYTE